MPARHFVKYTFLKVDPAWRRLDDEQRAADKREFIAACEDFADGHLLRAFSLVGTRGDADLMLLSQAQNLERIHEFHVVLAQSGLMKWCTVPYSLLAMTKPSEYSDESRLEVRPGHGKYLFVYPFVKTRAWYALPADERWRIMQEHIKVGPRVSRRSTSTPATRSASTTRSSWSPSRPTTRPTSWTSSSGCARPSPAPTRCATPRRSRASRARSSAPSARSTAPRCRSPRRSDDGGYSSAAIGSRPLRIFTSARSAAWPGAVTVMRRRSPAW